MSVYISFLSYKFIDVILNPNEKTVGSEKY